LDASVNAFTVARVVVEQGSRLGPSCCRHPSVPGGVRRRACGM